MPSANRKAVRAPSRDLVVFFCFIFLMSMFGWFVVSVYRRSEQDPRLKAGMAAMQRGDMARARVEFDKAVAKRPFNVETFQTVIAVCRLTHHPDIGVLYATRGLQDGRYAPISDRVDIYVSLANALAESEPEHPQTGAIAAARRAVELAPNDPTALNQLGYLLADNDLNLDEAGVLLTRALVLVQHTDESGTAIQTAAVRDSYGWFLYRKEQYAAAVDSINEAVNEATDAKFDAEGMKALYYHLGAAMRRSGNAVGARRALERSLALDPKYRPAREELSALLAVGIPTTPRPKPHAPVVKEGSRLPHHQVPNTPRPKPHAPVPNVPAQVPAASTIGSKG